MESTRSFEKGFKKVSDSQSEWMKCIQYEDINGSGRLFGGRLMEWMDEVAGIAALRHSGRQVTTVAVDNLKFKKGALINDVVVIPRGSRVHAKVTKATGSGLFGRAGKLEFMIESVESVNGVKIPLEYTSLREAGSDDGAIAVVAAVSVIGGLFMKGKNVSFPAGSKFAAKVKIDTDLNVTLDNLAEEMNPNKPHGVSITLK